MSREDAYPLGAAVTLQELEREPHPVLARLRASEPVSWLPALGGWLVTSYDLALEVMRNAEGFTVDDPGFSTAQVLGPSMLSLDGENHARHRSPFVSPFRPGAVRERFSSMAAAEAERLIEGWRAAGRTELRRSFAGPLAASIMARGLGLESGAVSEMLSWYDAIVGAVSAITAGRRDDLAAGHEAFGALERRLRSAIEAPEGSSLLTSAAGAGTLSTEELISNAAVLLFGGIETTEGMIANAVLHLIARPDQLALVRSEAALLGAAIEESLRLEPAAAVIDRYATRDIRLGEASVAGRDLVRVSIAAANRDPEVFTEPDRFDLRRTRSRTHVAFAHGPHVCLGVHLARLETRAALAVLLDRLPNLRLDPERPSEVRGLVFRKPVELNVIWD